jgi:hypothetical protein
MEILLTQNQTAIIDDDDAEQVNRHKWYAHRARGSFYAVRSVVDPETGQNRQMFLHREMMGDPPGMQVDHRNENTLDCRKANLRVATHQQNTWNRGAHNVSGGRTTPYKGVFLDRTHGRFKASIQHDKKRLSLGYFDTAEEAARAYDSKCSELRGGWASLNFPLKPVAADTSGRNR